MTVHPIEARPAPDVEAGAWRVTLRDEYGRLRRGWVYRGDQAEQRAAAKLVELRA